MDQIKRFVWPIATGGSVLLIALIALVAFIAPEGHKVSTANASKITLLAQETSLQSEISSLSHEAAREARELLHLASKTSPWYHFYTHGRPVPPPDLTTTRVTPELRRQVSASRVRERPLQLLAHLGAETVAITLDVSGTYRQALNFLNGLDNVHSLQRLYAVSSVTLSGGSTAGGVYTLQLQGDIYYSTGQQDVCSTSKTTPGQSST